VDLQSRCCAALRDGLAPITFGGKLTGGEEVRAVAAALGEALSAAGLPSPARIGFIPRNRPWVIAGLLELLGRGDMLVMIHAYQSPEAIARDVARLDLSAVVASSEDVTPALAAAVQAHAICGIELMEGRALKFGAERMSSRPSIARPGVEFLTSGTTGPPKHIGFSFEQVGRMVDDNIVPTGGAAAPPQLVYFPMGNISGFRSVLSCALHQREILLLDRFDFAAWRAYVRAYQPSVAALPTVALSMALEAKVDPAELQCLRVVITGASPLDRSVQKAFEQHYGVVVLLSYGATEFGGPVTQTTAEDRARFGDTKIGSVGRPYGGSQVRILDVDTGEAVGAGVIGRLEVLAPRVSGAWISTSDLGSIDEDGFLFLHGRADGAIMRGGFKILPESIERALALHPSVAAAAVVGLEDVRLGQVPGAAIELAPGIGEMDVAVLDQHLRRHVPATHIPTQWLFVERLPRNITMKLDLGAVRGLFASATSASAFTLAGSAQEDNP